MMATDERSAKLTLDVQAKNTDKSAKAIAGIGKEVGKLDKDLNALGKDTRKTFNEASAAIDDTADSLRDAAKAADDYDSRIRKVKEGGADFSGDVASSTAGLRGAVDVFSGGNSGAVGSLLEFGEAIADVGEFAPMAATQLTQLASSVGLTTPMAAALVVGLAAVAAAFALATSEAQKNADIINSTIDKRRELDKAIIEGMNTEQARAELDKLIKLRDAETETLADIETAYRELERQNLGNLDVFKALNVEEEALSTQAGTSRKNLADMNAEIEQLNMRLEDNAFAANDTKVEEQELAEVRQTETPQAIETAKNAERDRAREMEKVAREQERAAAEAAREQERIAAEQQRRAEQAAAAQQKYADGIKNANTALKQATQDINTKLSQGLADNLEGMFRDVTDIATQYRRDTFDMDLKANQAERDALTEHYRDIDDITEDALKSEQEALREGDFKQAFLAKQAGADALKQEQKETRREGDDRRRALGDERADLLRNAERTRADRMLAFERQNADTRTAAQRELQQATLTRTRALEMNAASYKSELAALGTFLQQRNNLLATANQAALAQIGGGRGNASGLNNTGRSIQQQMIAAVGNIVRR